MQYFAQWLWPENHGIDPLSARRAAAIDAKGTTYVAYLPSEKLVLTLRRDTLFVDLGFVSAAGERRGGVAILGDPPRFESIDVCSHDEEIVRLQASRDSHTFSTLTAPFDEPREFEARDLPPVTFPDFGDYEAFKGVSHDPWSYVVLPDDFDPPRP